jgi:hypothetical protein
MTDLVKLIGAIAAVGTFLFSAGRYVGGLEQRIANHERTQRYLHGDVHIPQGE